jgi:hypothetical protein
MAFKYPLVSNSSTLTIEELPAGDELVLDNLTVPGNASISGNANIGNIGTSGFITATGNITGGNINFGAGRVSGTGNVYASNFIGNISGNIDAAGSNTWVQFNDTGDLLGASAGFTFTKTSNAVAITGNVTGGNINTAGVVSSTGNITGGNILTGGVISATGNITGSYILGNGSQLTGIDATSIQNGTSNVRVVSSGGNVVVGVGGTSNVVVVASTGEYVTGVLSASGNVTGGNLVTGGLISATGNITGGNILGGANVNATTHTGTTVSVTANIHRWQFSNWWISFCNW